MDRDRPVILNIACFVLYNKVVVMAHDAKSIQYPEIIIVGIFRIAVRHHVSQKVLTAIGMAIYLLSSLKCSTLHSTTCHHLIDFSHAYSRSILFQCLIVEVMDCNL